MTDAKQLAFMRAYRPCHDAFVRYCSALAYGQMDTEDLVQDVLLAAYTHFDQIKDKNRFLHYLIRVARNKTISRWRKRRHQTEQLDKHHHNLQAQGVRPETILDIQLLYQTMNRLPEQQRDALILFEISGFSIKEIAEIQNSTVGAIKTRLSRGRKRLRALLAEKPIKQSINQLFGTLQTVVL